ncbi:MAG: YciI family protein [Planctomycetota bacterium]
MTRSLLLALSLCLFAGACRSTERANAAPSANADYVLVFLRVGATASEKSADERQTIQAAHMANIHRLADEGALLLAGPFGKPMPDAALRGIFVFDRASVAEAQKLTESDPAVQQGVLALDAHPCTSSPALREIMRLEKDAEARRKAANDPGMRQYVMLVADDGARAVTALAPIAAQDKVLITAHLGGDLAGRCLFVLDAAKLEDADALLAPMRAELGTCAVYPWWATDSLVQLPGLEHADPH